MDGYNKRQHNVGHDFDLLGLVTCVLLLDQTLTCVSVHKHAMSHAQTFRAAM